MLILTGPALDPDQPNLRIPHLRESEVRQLGLAKMFADSPPLEPNVFLRLSLEVDEAPPKSPEDEHEDDCPQPSPHSMC